MLPRLAAVLALVLSVSHSARAAELDPLLPADTETLVRVNFRQLFDAEVFKSKLLGPARQMLKESPEVADVLNDLGFDLFKDLDKVIVASPTGTETDRGLVIVRGTFDLAKFKKKADDTLESNPDVLKVHKVPLGGGDTHILYEVVVPNQDLSLYVALVDSKTLVVSPGKDYVVDGLKKVKLKQKAVLKNKDFQALLEKLDPKLTVSMAVLGKAFAGGDNEGALPEAVTKTLANVEAIGGGLLVSNEFKAELVVVGKDERSARVLRETTDKAVKVALVGLTLLGENRKELSLLLEVLKTVKVSGKGKTVGFTARLTADVLDDFFKKDE